MVPSLDVINNDDNITSNAAKSNSASGILNEVVFFYKHHYVSTTETECDFTTSSSEKAFLLSAIIYLTSIGGLLPAVSKIATSFRAFMLGWQPSGLGFSFASLTYFHSVAVWEQAGTSTSIMLVVRIVTGLALLSLATMSGRILRRRNPSRGQ